MLYYPSQSNTLVALPRETFGLYLRFYNKNIFSEAGVDTPDVDYKAGNWTWETWRDKAQATTVFDDSGRRQIMGANQGVDLWNLAYVLPSLGVPMLSDDQAHFNLNEQEVIDWLTMIRDMVADGAIGKPEETEEFDWGASGKQAISADASWSIPNRVETWADFEWDFVPPPKGAGGHSNVPGCDFHAVNGSENANHEGGWEIVKFLNSPEEDLWWAINMFGPPFRQANLQAWIDQVSTDLPKDGWQYISDAMESAHAWPTVPFFLELETIHQNEIGQAITGERPVEEVANSIVQKVDEAIANFE
jgi:ABC-type glycerol-3-phosphate transport system substrate-binding protein